MTSPTRPIDSDERHAKARHLRREAAAPYPISKREKGEEREFSGRGTARRGGFFSRLATYIPIVNKLIQEDDVEGGKANKRDDEIKMTPEEESQEVVEVEEVTLSAEKEEIQATPDTQEVPESLYPEAIEKEKMLEDEAMLDTPTVPSFITDKGQVTMSSRHINNKTGSGQVSSVFRESGTENGGRSSALMPPWRKRGDKSVLPPGPSQPITQRRWRSTSASPHELALGVIKDKKAITLEEFERLQHQLYEMVETTPQTQLAITQTALANGLEHPFTRGFPGPTSFPGYPPGSVANQNHGAVDVQDERKRGSEYTMNNGETFSERPRNCENGPVLFSGTTLRRQMTSEERLQRKPRPSRLLTGTKRKISARYTYSAAAAEKILSTLSKLQSPLEQEAQKPTPSTTMLWAKCHSSVVDGQKNSFSNGMEIGNDDVPPPTSTVPRVAFPQPQHSKKPAALSFGSTPNTAFETPSKSDNTVSTGVTSLFSPQAVSMTPAPIAKTSAPEQPQFQTTGEFKFTLPVRVEGVKQADTDDEDTRVRFVFSPPPSMLEPPMKTSKRRTARRDGNAPAPFDFMPSSPKMNASEWVAKPLTVKEPEKRKADSKKPIAAETAEESSSGSTAATAAAAPTASLNGGVNPLARFMQLKPGQWKCPGCSVLNEATSAKCPCCETAKPGGGATEKEKTSSVASNAPGEISSSGFSIGLATEEAKKDSNKSAAGSITEGGFCFGAPLSDSKKDTEKPAASISSNGFTFSAPAAGATTNKSAAEITSGGFSFAAPVASDDSAAGDVDSGTAAASNAKADSFASTAPISFGFSAPVVKADEASTKLSAVIGKAVPASSFSFGPEPTPDQTSAATSSRSVSSGFTFGVTGVSTADGTSTGKRKAPEAEVSTNDCASSFNFGTTAPTNSEAPKANTATGFSFGVATEPKQASQEESGRPTKRLAASTAASESKPDASAFTFDAASKPLQVPAKESAETPTLTSSFNFGGSSSLTTTQKPEGTTSSAFSFGATSTEGASVPTEAKIRGMMPSKTGFTFGSSSPAEPKPTAGFGKNTESEASAFSFGLSASTSTPASSTQATTTSASSSAGFTFGQNTTVATSSAPAFGAAPSAPAFGFGASMPTPPPAGTSSSPNAEMSSAAASTPAFTFGLSSAKPAGASAFGQTPASTSSFGSTSTAFGSSSSNGFGSGSNVGGFGSKSTAAPSTTFGNSVSSTPASSALSFEASSQAPAVSAPAPTAAKPVFTFGASNAPTSNGYGAAPAVSSGFGSSGPSGGFGAAPGGFRSSSSASAFGNQSASAFGSNRPPLTSAFGAGFSSGPPSSGFPTPSSTPAFGATQAAPPFGAAPAPAFSAAPNTAFGATSNTAFGAAPASAFGAAPASAFGAAPASAFGATPNTAFGAAAPAPGFGAPTAGAFGASADGGFNMGVAPQHAKNRRIVKAKVRSRRTSSKRE